MYRLCLCARLHTCMYMCVFMYMHVHADVYSMCGCKVFMHVINACYECMLLMHVYGYKYKWMSTPECSCTYLFACSSMAICVYVCKLQGCVVCALVLQTKPKKNRVACDRCFWITFTIFLLLVLAFVAAFFAWNHCIVV